MDIIKESKETDTDEGHIIVSIDSYNSLFSDFDPRDYSERGLSEDFVDECRRAVKEHEEEIELVLLCPEKKRNQKEEAKIKKRIKEYFSNRFKKEENIKKKLIIEGIFWFIAGSALMTIAVILEGKSSFLLKFLEVMVVPAGWFFFWEGLDKVLITSRERLGNYNFYKKMSKATISFENSNK